MQQRLLGAVIDRKIFRCRDRQVQVTGLFAYRGAAERQARELAGATEELIVRGEQFARRQYRLGQVVAAVFVARLDLAPELGQRRLQAVAVHHQGVARQIIPEGVGALVEQRQEIFDATRGDAVADILIDGAATEVDVETLAERLAETADAGFGHRHFAPGQQSDAFQRFLGTLRFRVEPFQRVDLVVEQVDANRAVGAHREDVENGAAHGELAMLVDGVGGAVTGAFQLAPLRS